MLRRRAAPRFRLPGGGPAPTRRSTCQSGGAATAASSRCSARLRRPSRRPAPRHCAACKAIRRQQPGRRRPASPAARRLRRLASPNRCSATRPTRRPLSAAQIQVFSIPLATASQIHQRNGRKGTYYRAMVGRSALAIRRSALQASRPRVRLRCAVQLSRKARRPRPRRKLIRADGARAFIRALARRYGRGARCARLVLSPSCSSAVRIRRSHPACKEISSRDRRPALRSWSTRRVARCSVGAAELAGYRQGSLRRVVGVTPR